MEKVEVNVSEGQKELILRQGTANNEFQYKGFQYKAFSTESFIALVKAKAEKHENAVVTYDDEGMAAILDDKVIDRPQDRISYKFRTSQQFEEWENILSERGVTFDQKGIIDFLRRREEGELEDVEFLIGNLQNFKYATNISGEAFLEDGNNYTCAIKVNGVEGETKLPKVIFPEIEVYNESGFKQSMEIEIEVIKPKSQEEKIAFKLSCPKIYRYVKKAVEYEVATLKTDLEGFLIVTGEI